MISEIDAPFHSCGAQNLIHGGGSAWQIACKPTNLIQVQKNEIFAFFLSVPSQLIL